MLTASLAGGTIHHGRAALSAQAPADANQFKGNYDKLFDEARERARAWEQTNVK